MEQAELTQLQKAVSKTLRELTEDEILAHKEALYELLQQKCTTVTADLHLILCMAELAERAMRQGLNGDVQPVRLKVSRHLN